VLETTLHPRRPYSLADTFRLAYDPTRTFRGGVLQLALRAGGEPALARVWQRPDGSLGVRIDAARPDAAHDRVRFVLGAGDDVAPFLALAASDALLAPLVRRRPGLRATRLTTVTHALVRALSGQLITWQAAKEIERRLLWRISPRHGPFRLPPEAADVRAVATARFEGAGLSPARSAALGHLCRRRDPERLRAAPPAAAVTALLREPCIGPWSAGVVALLGLGSYAHGLVGDLGLVKLLAGLWRRPVEPEETRELLAPYGEWAGLASLHLLGHPLVGSARARAAIAGGRRWPAGSPR
jgi:3-methyladenine DNA glycosylase/8-oxoguanine DNA glycosylase